ncbi:MAG TPA: hypothetical protein VF306_01670 [Pirellulales bacterium]
MKTTIRCAALALMGTGMLLARNVSAADGKSPPAKQAAEKIDIADGKFAMAAPEGWQRKQPKINFIEHEFEVPAAEGDERPGRVTVMGAGGSIEDNLKRWYGQFRQPGGEDTADQAKVEQKTVTGQPVTLVDVSGTYLDKPGGPFAGGKTVEREDYRMLAAIIETTQQGKKTGNYFIKLIGPRKTIADNQKAFDAMIDSLKQQ